MLRKVVIIEKSSSIRNQKEIAEARERKQTGDPGPKYIFKNSVMKPPREFSGIDVLSAIKNLYEAGQKNHKKIKIS